MQSFGIYDVVHLIQIVVSNKYPSNSKINDTVYSLKHIPNGAKTIYLIICVLELCRVLLTNDIPTHNPLRPPAPEKVIPQAVHYKAGTVKSNAVIISNKI